MADEGSSYTTKVALVESNSRPGGYQLVNTYMTNRNADPVDLVELAKQVQKINGIVEESIPFTLGNPDWRLGLALTYVFGILYVTVESGYTPYANEFVKATAGSKLLVIADQIRYLQEQAKKALEEARRDDMLHHAACNLVKKPGQMYFLYERESGQKYFSILSPQEWGASCPHAFVGAFKLEHDMSWTPIDKVGKRSDDFALVDKILNTQKAITNPESQVFKGLTSETLSSPKINDVSDT